MKLPMDNLPDREVAVFNAALQLPAGQRAAYLDEACAGENALRLKIEALLRVHDEVGAFLDIPTQEVAPSAAAEELGRPGTIRVSAPPIEKIGERIGRYKLLQQIGEGGCGVVYMAEQEEPVRRKVALKVIKLGMDTKHVIARFEAERQALALMDHPNIAKVLDAGATDTGRPFFVMELVRGIKITDYCDENKLATEDRLRLFTQVCQAIQHAHQKGIIHRDIKPSNILVADHDGVPVPKVIDFGIAKATTDQRLTDKTLFTALEQFIGTPAYMSPEQARLSGLDIDTRTDIYSLGVLLYELLTSKTPFDAKQLLAAGLEEMRRTIREQEPARPSTALSTMLAADLTTVAKHRQSDAPKLVHLVRGDLDWIVMKALEKDRARRYETANGLALDIQRHLNNEPVSARPPTSFYRFQKMVRRNKLTFAFVSLVAAILVLGAMVASWEAIRTTRAGRTERRLRQQAENDRLRAQTAERIQSELRARAEASAAESRERLIRLQTDAGLRLVADGDVGGSLPFLAEAAVLSQQGSSHAEAAIFRLQADLQQWPKLARMLLHPGPVGITQFSADGSRLLTLCPKNGARVWDVMTGNPITPLLTNFADARVACLSWDGRRIAIGGSQHSVWQLAADSGMPIGPKMEGPQASSDGVDILAYNSEGTRLLAGRSLFDGEGTTSETRIWDASTGLPLTPPMLHSSFLNAACWSPDGQRIATASGDGTGGLWDAKTGARIATLTMEGQTSVAAFSPDGKRLVMGGWTNGAGIARVWDGATGQPITALWKHIAGVVDVQFSPDGRRLVTTEMDQAARIRDPFTGEALVPFFSHNGAIRSTHFSPDGRIVATASADGTARLWDAATGKLLASLCHGREVQDAEFSPDGNLLVTTSADHFARIWDLASLENRPLELDRQAGLESVSFSSDGTRVATENLPGIVRVWDATLGTCLLTVSNRTRINRTAAFSPDGRSVAAADGTYDLTGKQLVAFPKGNYDVQFSSSGRKIFLLAVPGNSSVVTIDAATGRTIAPPLGERNPRVLYCTALSLNEKVIATAERDGYVRLWDATTGNAIGPPLSHEQKVSSLAFSPDNATLASCCRDDTVRLWDVSTGQQRTPPLKHSAQVKWAAFSPDGRRVATASWDNTARIWDVATGRPLTAPLRHRLHVNRVLFSPDGRFVLTGSGALSDVSLAASTAASVGYDGEARLWDAASGELAAPPFRCENAVERVCFSPNGRRILVADFAGTARIWNLPLDSKPVADLLTLAQVLSGQRISAATGPEPMAAAALNADFQKLRAKYPDEFAFTLNGDALWREQRAATSERDGDWYAAGFHLDRLIQARPDDSSLRERRTRAQTELDKLVGKP
jgi:eukaryotic-like serine/threonine-protein kinase